MARGGAFTPATVTFANNTSTPATFTYTPSSAAGAKTISTTNNGGLTNPSALTYTASAPSAATAYTLSGPSSGAVSSASSAFTVTSNGFTGIRCHGHAERQR